MDHPAPADTLRESAVLVALVDGPDGAEVLLTRRSQTLSSHRGEISFPGGRVDAGETFEPWSEGLDPLRLVALAVSPAYAQDRLVYALGLGGTVWRRQDHAARE